MRALVIVVLLASTAHAEIVEKGVRAGANILGVSSGGDETYNAGPGPTFGAFLVYAFNDRFALQLDTLVSGKLLEVENCHMMTPCADLGSLDLWYVELPILARIDLLQGKTKLHLDGGPQLLVSLGGTRKIDDMKSTLDDPEPFNIGITVGGGVEIQSGPGHITIDARYARSLADKIVNDGAQTLRQTNQLLIAFGYAFP